MALSDLALAAFAMGVWELGLGIWRMACEMTRIPYMNYLWPLGEGHILDWSPDFAVFVGG